MLLMITKSTKRIALLTWKFMINTGILRSVSSDVKPRCSYSEILTKLMTSKNISEDFSMPAVKEAKYCLSKSTPPV